MPCRVAAAQDEEREELKRHNMDTDDSLVLKDLVQKLLGEVQTLYEQ